MAIDLSSELTDLRRSVMEMAAAVEQRLSRAIDALLKGDQEAAMAVRTGDGEIDAMEVDIEQQCLRILALTQPVAGDLRVILAMLRINTELERVADLARSVAKRAMDLDRLRHIDMPEALVKMADATRRMFADALESLARGEPALARRVRAADQRVDDLQKEIFVWVQAEIPHHVESTAAALDVLTAARKLERIADLSTNIAEEVIFLVEGRLVRHASP